MRWWKIALTLSTVPVGHLLVSAEFDFENTLALLSCIPRTFRAVCWATRAGFDYYHHQDDLSWTDLHDHWASELTSLCRTNGGVYVKAAQLASTTGAVPLEYRRRLSQLHDKCSPESFSRIQKSLRKEFGQDCKDRFLEIEEVPTAAASIAQVHSAKLKSGQKVALKIQYPALEAAISADLTCLLFLSCIADYTFPKCQLNWILKRLKKDIFQEMDFRVEIKNAQSLENRIKHRSDIKLPKIFLEHCTSRCLVMEWIDGCKLSDKEGLRRMDVNPRAVALTLLDAFSEMTLEHGFIHGDPHPGNLLVVPLPLDKRTHWFWRFITFQWRTPFQLVLLDHGRYIEMDQETRLGYCKLWCSLIRGDHKTAKETATRICHGKTGGELLPKMLYRPFDKYNIDI